MSWTDWKEVEGEGMAFEEILYDKKHHQGLGGGIARVTINKPDKYNTMSLATVDEMFRAFYEANHDPRIGVIIVAGAGKNFGTGGDVEWEQWGLREAFYNRYPHNRLIRGSRKPVLAVVQGYCLGGHNHMAYCCDFTLAADTAKFGQPEITLGVLPGAGGSQRLTRLVGKSKAMEMCLTGRMMDADEAERAGLVSRIVPADELLEDAMKTAAKIAAMSRPAAMMVKESINRSYETTLAEGVRFERRLFHSAFATEDQKEGMEAFATKRKPEWKNR